MLSYVPNDSIFSLAKERLRLQKASSFFPEGTGVLGYLLALPLGITDASTAGFVTLLVFMSRHISANIALFMWVTPWETIPNLPLFFLAF